MNFNVLHCGWMVTSSRAAVEVVVVDSHFDSSESAPSAVFKREERRQIKDESRKSMRATTEPYALDFEGGKPTSFAQAP